MPLKDLVWTSTGWRGALETTNPETPPTGNGRNSLIAGSYNPVAFSGPTSYTTNRVGIYGLGTLTTETEGGNLTYATAGQVIENVDFYRRVSVTASNITFRNCFFRGSLTENLALVTASNTGAVNTVFEDCTFAAQAPQYATVGAKLGSGGFTFRRCDFYGVIDGIAPANNWVNPVKLIQCAFHDLLLFSPDPGAIGGIDDNAGHVDCVQMAGGNLEVQGSGFSSFYDMTRYQAPEPNVAFGPAQTDGTPSYHMFGNKYVNEYTRAADASMKIPQSVLGQPSVHATSCLMMSPNTYPLGDIIVNQSYFDGGSLPVNINGGYTSANSFLFTNNKVGTHHRGNATNITVDGGSSGLRAAIVGTGNTDRTSGNTLAKSAVVRA